MLHRAAGHGLLRVAKWLLDHGADVNSKSQPDFWRWKGRTPLEFAVWECAEGSGRSTSEAMAALLIERWRRADAALGRRARTLGLSRVMPARLAAGKRGAPGGSAGRLS